MAWRNTRNPYRILVSEIMLQQTQVERVREKYAAFIRAFPNVRTLANASLGDVLRLWSGLGYNRRAKYLHECAKEVSTQYGGKFPTDIPTLMTLPGIGISTSAALVAFAHGADEPMIDTNIRRVLSRVFFPLNMSRLSLDMSPRSDRELFQFAKSLIPKGMGREWNYAMLDIAATQCTARNHRDECPLQDLHGKVGDFVYKKPQKKFAQSDRYYRGRVLAHLAKKKMNIRQLESVLDLKTKDLRVLLRKLQAEGLVEVRGQNLQLPS